MLRGGTPCDYIVHAWVENPSGPSSEYRLSLATAEEERQQRTGEMDRKERKSIALMMWKPSKECVSRRKE